MNRRIDSVTRSDECGNHRSAKKDSNEIAATQQSRSHRLENKKVGNVVMFLLSDEASYVSGAEIVVDGGLIAG